MRRISDIAPVVLNCVAVLTVIAPQAPAEPKGIDTGSIKGQNDKANTVAPREGMVELEILRLESRLGGGVG